MGHYHRIINLTQRTVIEPTDADVLDKIVEFGSSPGTAMGALWLLLGGEAWCGDRIAILGYEGRPGDLAPEVIAETGLDGTSYYARLGSAAELARGALVERGICTFTPEQRDGYVRWRRDAAVEVEPAGVDVVVADLDRGELLDPAQFGDNRDLHLAAAFGGFGGVTEALTAMLAASCKGGSRGGGDLRSWSPLVGSWAGDRIGVIPMTSAHGMTDVSGQVRDMLAAAGQGRYDITPSRVVRARPPWWDDAMARRRGA